MRGSPLAMSSQSAAADDSKSGALSGITCQFVTPRPRIDIERIDGICFRRLSWCSLRVATQTPFTERWESRCRSAATILPPIQMPKQPNIGRTSGSRCARRSATKANGGGARLL